jgi:hypothetical protein
MLEQIGIPCRVNPASASEPADFVIFFQSYPHEFLPSDLMQLRRKNPFAPFFFVLGTCCEGMLRTAAPLDSPFYRYVHEWDGTETEQLRAFLTDQPSLFALPLTAGSDEIALWLTAGIKGSPSTAGRWVGDSRLITRTFECGVPHVAARRSATYHNTGVPAKLLPKCLILTHFGPFGNDSAMNRLLADEQEQLGYKPVFSGKTLPKAFVGKIVADADNSPTEKILKTIKSLRRRFADNDFAVYVDSPRINEKTGYIQAGVSHILPKIQ